MCQYQMLWRRSIDHWSFAMDLEDSYLMMLSRSTLNEKTSDHRGTCKHNINFATEQKFSEQVKPACTSWTTAQYKWSEWVSRQVGCCMNSSRCEYCRMQQHITNAQVPMISPIVEHAVSYEPHGGCNYSWQQNADATSCWQCISFRVHDADCFLCTPSIAILHRENVDAIERKKKCTLRSAKWTESVCKFSACCRPLQFATVQCCMARVHCNMSLGITCTASTVPPLS